jgi:predicted Ser/Thr protein kinase
MSAADFLRQIEEQRRLEKQIAWEGTFREYLEIVQQEPEGGEPRARAYIRYDNQRGR